MSIFEPAQAVLAEGHWRVKVNVSAEAVEYITHERALRVADELEAEGWRGICRAAAAGCRDGVSLSGVFPPMSGIQAALEFRQLHAELEAARRSGDVARMERASKALLEFVGQRCSPKA